MLFDRYKLTDRSGLTDALIGAIEDAYRVFAHYELPRPLRVCYCNVCVSQDDARHLVETPLRQIPVELLSEYTSSAHGYDEEMHGSSLRYFLPRYFELIALNQAPDHNNLPQCLGRLRQADYRHNWSTEEADVIARYFDALLADKLRDVSVIKWPVGYRLGYPMDELLEMMVLAGGDVRRILGAFEAAADPGASLHIAGLAEKLIFRDGAPEYSSVMIKRSDPACYELGAFLADPRHSARLEAVFFDLEAEPVLQKILSDGHQMIGALAAVTRPEVAR
ncbi:MAG: hypothetical protein IT368_05740 [Candidatus Hydrogenedentes bacterium]|nr:hypothetical protein [Candidatus Hydrogenedentota bacterium]